MMYAAWARTLASANTEPLKQKTIKGITKGLSSKRPAEAEFVAAFQALRYSDKATKQKKLVQYILETLRTFR